MEWLLITTMGKNPGDEFIRMGIMNMIRELDKDATYILLDKESPSAVKTVVKFDKCIWCGMPVFWSNGANRNNIMPWWNNLMLDWISERKEDFLVFGAGSFFPWDIQNSDEIVYKEDLTQSVEDVLARSLALIARDPFVAKMTGVEIPSMVCPAVFSVMDFRKSNDLKMANLMPSGSHYTEFGPGEALIWKIQKKKIAQILIDNGFTFIAHSIQEIQFAQECGWERIITYDGDLSSLLKYYGQCGKFFGNRVHGAITARGNNAEAWAVGYDSRMEAVRLSGARVNRPSELDIGEIEQWAQKPIETVPFDFDNEFNRQINILRQFIESKQLTHSTGCEENTKLEQVNTSVV